MFLFLSYSFGIETVNTFIHSRSSLENHTRFQTKMGKVYTRFQTKTAQKPYPLGRHIPIWLIKGVPPGIRHKFSFGSIHKFHSVSGLLFPQQKPVSFPFIYLFSDPKGSCCFFHFEITGLDFTSTGQNNPESKKLREKS